jgi:hypothetical protein
LLDLVITWVAYSVLAGVFLTALSRFQVRTLSALFLCAALYGWLVEGVLAGTLYDAFPLQISWTGLAWHALLSACAGWYGLGAALRNSTRRTALVAAGLGGFWGAWAITWWQPEEGGIVTPLPAFASHAFLQGGMLAAAFALAPRLVQPHSYTARWGTITLITVLAAWFLLVTLPHHPFSLMIATVLFTLTVLTLHRSRTQPGASSTVLADYLQPPPWKRYAALLVLPTCAVLVYALFLQGGQPVATHIVAFWIMMPLGFVAYGASLYKVWKGSSP